MSRPWLTVVMPTFEGERWVGDALASIAPQADGVEVVVVDDGSTDRTLEIVRSWADRLDLRWEAGPRRGNWVAATNRGIGAARGRHLSFLHQDDLWLPGRVQAVRAVLAEQPDLALVVHHATFLDPGGRRAGRWSCPLPTDRPVPSETVLHRLLVQNFLAISAPVFPRALLEGPLDEALWYTADWNLWLELAARGPAYAIGRPLTGFRLHPDSLTARGSAAGTEFRRQLEVVLARHLGRAEARGPLPASVERAARLSLEVNVVLAGRAHGHPLAVADLASALLAAGPAGLWRYRRDGRLRERVTARLRVGLGRGRGGSAAGPPAQGSP